MEPLLGQATVGQARLGVVDGVEPEGRGERFAERSRQRPDVVERHGVVAPHRVADLAGPVRRQVPGCQPRDEIVGQDARRCPGGRRAGEPAPRLRPAGWPCVESTRSRSSTRPRRRRAGRHGRRSCPSSTAGRAGTPRRSSAGRRPAGPRGARAGPRRSRARDPRGPARSGPARRRHPTARPRQPGRPAAGRRPRRRSPATADRPGPGARAATPGEDGSSRPSARRSGRVSVAPSAGCGRCAELAVQPRLERAGEQPGGRDREAGLERGRGLVAGERPALEGDDRPRVEAGVHPDQGHAGLARRRRGSRRDRRRAAVARQERRVQVQTPHGGTVQELGRHDLAVVGEDDEVRLEPEDVGDRGRVAEPLRRWTCEAQLAGLRSSIGVGRLDPPPPDRPRSARSRRRRGRSPEVPRAGPSVGWAKRPVPRKTVRTGSRAGPAVSRGVRDRELRRPGRRPGHAERLRRLVRPASCHSPSASPSSSSPSAPTGMSSSIESR